jgi:major inositol transporter-like SP family MFS transporter
MTATIPGSKQAQPDPSDGQSSLLNATPTRALTTIAVISTLGGLLFGYDTGVISGALIFMKGDLGLTSFTEGGVVSSLLLGAAFGAPLGGRLADQLGRRLTIRVAAVVFAAGALGCALAPNVEIMVAARVVLGLAVGCASATVPLYSGELAPADRRGRLVTQNELMIVTGQLLAFTTNAVIDRLWGGQGTWRWMLGIAALPAVLLWIGMLFLPDTPRWYALKGRFDEADDVLQSVREPQEVPAELDLIRETAERDAGEQQGGWADLREPWIRRLFVIGIGIAVAQQITGINTVMYYAPTILESTGLGSSAALTATISVGVISVVMTIVGMGLLGRVRRRPMLITGQVGCTLSLLALGLSFLLPESATRSYVVLMFMVVFVAFQQCAISTVVWLMLSEIFPMKIRGFGMGVAIFVLWMVNFGVSLLFPVLNSALGSTWSFLFFFAVNIGSVVFTAMALPETAGRTLEGLEEEFRARYA